ncbi:MAG: hypothetical protein GC201_13140 [Alphaproteobacteria bacterium]|nr:hypothetical protein [Alphaproteobacteria bacterium]
MRRAAVAALLLAFSASPTLGQHAPAPPAAASVPAPSAARQPMLNITTGSPATPGGKALIDLAEQALVDARHAADRMVAGGPASAVAAALDGTPGAGDRIGFVRAVAGIAANAELAARAKDAPGSLPAAAARVDTCAGTLIDRAEAAAGLSDAAAVKRDLDALADGIDVNGDGTAGWSDGECGLAQLKALVAQMAADAGA